LHHQAYEAGRPSGATRYAELLSLLIAIVVTVATIPTMIMMPAMAVAQPDAHAGLAAVRAITVTGDTVAMPIEAVAM
jgi:hypothetical protein